MRKFLKKLHLYLALTFCISLTLQGLSGSILILEKPIAEFFLKQNHVFVEGEIAQASALIRAAQAKIPEGFVANFVKFPLEKNSAAVVRFTKNTPVVERSRDNGNLGDEALAVPGPQKKGFREVLIDAVSLEVLKVQNPEENFFYWVKKFHTNLLIQGEVGRNIVGIFGIILLLMTISGIVIWWPKKFSEKSWAQLRSDFRLGLTFDFKSKGIRFYRGLHGFAGFWTFGFLFIASFSGIYLAFPKQMTQGITAVFGGEDLKKEMNAITTPHEVKKEKIDEVVSLASEHFQDLRLVSLNIPTKSNQPFRVNFAEKNSSKGGLVIAVFVDSNESKIIRGFDPEFYLAGEKIIVLQPLLHEGKGLGIIWKTLVFFVGFLPILFAITGISLWWKKRKNRVRI